MELLDVSASAAQDYLPTPRRQAHGNCANLYIFSPAEERFLYVHTLHEPHGAMALVPIRRKVHLRSLRPTPPPPTEKKTPVYVRIESTVIHSVMSYQGRSS